MTVEAVPQAPYMVLVGRIFANVRPFDSIRRQSNLSQGLCSDPTMFDHMSVRLVASTDERESWQLRLCRIVYTFSIYERCGGMSQPQHFI